MSLIWWKLGKLTEIWNWNWTCAWFLKTWNTDSLTIWDTLWPCESYLPDSSGSSDSLSDHFLLFLGYSELFWYDMHENWCFYGRMPSVTNRVEGCTARAYDLSTFLVWKWHALHVQVTFDWLWMTQEWFVSMNMWAWPIIRHWTFLHLQENPWTNSKSFQGVTVSACFQG